MKVVLIPEVDQPLSKKCLCQANLNGREDVSPYGGKGGGDLIGLADPLLIVPSSTTARIQEMHIMLGQMLCAAIEIELGLV